jgi:AraC-like DNA-binding protein
MSIDEPVFLLYIPVMGKRKQGSQLTTRPRPVESIPFGHQEWLARAKCDRMPFETTAPIYAEAQGAVSEPPSIHIHHSLEVGILLVGEQQRFYEGWSCRAVPGDVWLIPVLEPHGWEAAPAHSEIVVLHFLPELLGNEMIGDLHWLASFAAPAPGRPRVRTEEVREQVLAIGHELWTEIHDRPYAWTTVLRANLLRLLAILNRHWERPRNSATSGGINASNLARIMPVLSTIQQDPARRMALSEAAGLCGLGWRQFQRVFSQTLGVGFQRFCLRGRLAQAERLLIGTDLAVEAVATASGFVDLPHLHRHFVKHYGCTPGAFRRRVQARG